MSLETASRETRLQWFARQVIDEMWNGGDVDGGSIQSWARKAGLIVPDTVTEDNIEEICNSDYLEPGDTFYRFSDDLKDVNWDELSEPPDEDSADEEGDDREDHIRELAEWEMPGGFN